MKTVNNSAGITGHMRLTAIRSMTVSSNEEDTWKGIVLQYDLSVQ